MGDRVTLTIKDQVNVKFDDLPPEVRRKISEACKYTVPYARHTPQFKLGRWDGKVAFATIGGSTFLNMLDKVLPLVIDAGYEIDIVDKRPSYEFQFPAITNDMLAHKVWPEGHPIAGQPIMLRDYQVEAIRRYLDNPQSIQSISTGAGKAQPLWSKIKTPGGWTTMGEIQPGDVVSTPDGGSAKVVSIHPQGEKEYYRLTFKDGRTAEACGDHLWNVYNVDKKKKMIDGVMTNEGNPWRTMTTHEVIDQMKSSQRPLRIQMAKPETRDDHDFMIHPYLLGCLLGDGALSHKTNITMSSADDHIIKRCNDLLDDEYGFYHKDRYDYTLRKTDDYKQFCASQPRGQRDKLNRYRLELERLGLKGTKSASKFIPNEYIELASFNQKMELVRGLIDTDGYVGKTGYCMFTTVSPRLASDFAELIRSVGGYAKIKTKKTTFRNNEGEKAVGQLAFNVAIRYPNPKELASLPRKKDRLPSDYQYSDLKLQITSIEKVGTTECQCILIDHPDHLYITDNYVVTHNTLLTATLSSVCEAYGRTIVVVPNKSLVEQTEEDYRNLGLDVGVFYGDRKEWGHKHTIATWQSLGAFNKRDKLGNTEAGGSIMDFIDGVVCVMVDEVHSAKAEVLKDLLTGPMANIPIRWGLTGTVPKEEFEFKALEVSLGPVVGEIKASDLQEQGVLAKCQIEFLQLQDDHVAFKTYASEYDFLTSDRDRLDYLAEQFANISQSGNTLILVDRIECGKYLTSMLPDAVFINGTVKTKDRKKEYKSVHTADNKIVVATYGVAAVGINIPRIFNLILIEPGKSFVRVIQSIGRGIRVAEDKDFVQVYDVTTNLKFSAKHITERKKFYKEANYPFTLTKVKYR